MDLALNCFVVTDHELNCSLQLLERLLGPHKETLSKLMKILDDEKRQALHDDVLWSLYNMALVRPAQLVSVAKMWENHLIRRGGRKGLKQYLQSRKIRVAATLLNFHFVCSTFLFFPEGLRLCIERISYVLIGGAG